MERGACHVCSSKVLVEVHIEAERILSANSDSEGDDTVSTQDAILAAAKLLSVELTQKDIGAIEYHIVSGGGVRWTAIKD